MSGRAEVRAWRPGLPGVVIVSPSSLSNEFEAAQTLIHESLHLKFMDIEYVHPLFVPGFRPTHSPLVTPVWHQGRPELGNWPIDRVLTSMHVYLGLSVFAARATRSSQTTGADGIKLRAHGAQCHTRAAWLHAAANRHLEVLSASGRSFLAWTGRLIEQLDRAGDEMIAPRPENLVLLDATAS